MKTLLIVEDEKAIRKGIAAMAKRAPVEIESVVECRDGLEAMEVLRAQAVDVMITDIRMPRMDGIELVRRASALPCPPLTVVVSGYDDFSYAVEVFRRGVRDYILKPIEREKLFETLSKLDEELSRSRRRKDSKLAVSSHVVRSLMLAGGPGEEEARAIMEQYGDVLFTRPYRVFCLSPNAAIQREAAFEYSLREMEGQWILLSGAQQARPLSEEQFRGLCTGTSGVHGGIASLRGAYLEAVNARKMAFCRGYAAEESDLRQESSEDPRVQEEIEQMVHLLGAGRQSEAKQLLGQLLIMAQNGKMSADAFEANMKTFLGQVGDTYGQLPEENRLPQSLHSPLAFENALAYYTELCRWIDGFCAHAQNQRTDENERKIHMATIFLRDHFGSEVDMAMVSNHVSMNYTQFSQLFKQYTGSNFVEYIKKVRIEEGKRLLRETEMRIGEISLKAGFKDEKHFMKVFKQSCGVSPSDYRRNLRTVNE
ncbi:response regulator [Ruminococcaceae bacterium OttesenSCG-928-I18]|nr:response regulator [Ruminococcaceae bacterium OttesenSCG-928-I18]